MDKELQSKIIAYRRTMSMAKAMLSEGTVSADDYAQIDTIIAKKYGLSSCSIFSEMTGYNGDLTVICDTTRR